MSLLVLISGLLNLSSQVLYQKVVSMTAGDLYTTFIIVTLSFILGAAIGSYFGYLLRRVLPLIELFMGLYTLFVSFLLTGAFYQFEIPSVVIMLGLVPPAVALGTHLPLYSYYLRRWSFGWVYGAYHLGAILGLFLVEAYFINAGSVKAALVFFGLAQVILGLILLIVVRQGKFKIEIPIRDKNIHFRNPVVRNSSIAIFVLSTLSFYQTFWALHTQVFFTEGHRLQLTMVSAAIFTWMTVGGAVSRWVRNVPIAIYFLFWAISCVAIQSGLAFLPQWIREQITGTSFNYFLTSYALALFTTLPILVSSLLFISETNKNAKPENLDQQSGYLNMFASLGNVSGVILAGCFAHLLWSAAYAQLAIAVCALGFIYFGIHSFKNNLVVSGGVFISGLILLGGNSQQMDEILAARFPDYAANSQFIKTISIYSNPFSSLVLAERDFKSEFKSDPKLPSASLFYFVDGHLSHDLSLGTEFMVGLRASKYFSTPPQKSLVIGLGTGQSAWSVKAISEKTDVLEISPAAVQSLHLLRDYNNGLQADDDFKIILTDGFSYLRKCPPGSYDFILNTATYPSNFNASKLYSEEFVELAKNCLSPSGIYETYFDYNVVGTAEELREFLAPLRKHFKYIDIMPEPYPLVFAYNEPRKLTPLNSQKILRLEDKDFFSAEIKTGFLPVKECEPVLRDVPFDDQPAEMNTLDRAILERNSLRNMIRNQASTKFPPELKDFLKALQTCE
jgi:spermidine synthase